jgi:hypothetical protein
MPEPAPEILILICEQWLRLLALDGHPPPNAQVRAVLADVAASAPQTARRAPALLYAIGARAAAAVIAQAAALDATEETLAAAGPARWVTPAQAAAVLGLKPDSVRRALRKGLIAGHRHECGWRLDAREVTRYKGRRYGDRDEPGRPGCRAA